MSVTRRLLSLLLCLLMIFSMFACSNEMEDYSDSASGSGSGSGITLPSEVPDNYISLAEHERANFRIVYEKSLASAVTQKITKNLNTLKTKIGVDMPMVDDTTLPAPDGMPEILIGETNREVSKIASAKLRSGEYTITYDKETNSVVIAGGSASALGTAIDTFFKNIDNNKRYLAIPNNYSVSKFLDFPIQSIVIDSVPIQDYTIVYPKNADLATKYAAQNLVDYIQTNMGVKLAMNDDGKAEKQYEILIGKTKRSASNISTTMKEGQYVLMKKGDKIVMQGNGIYVGAAVGAFASKYLPINGNKKQIEINNLSTSSSAQTYTFPSTFKNAVIMIGDGMGFNHIEMAKNGGMEAFYAEQFPNKGKARTRSLSVIEGKISYTDSAAAATALATGYKTYNERVGVDKNGSTLKNVRELADEKGAKTAVVTTDVIGGATPGGFLAHNSKRKVNNVTNPDIIKQIDTLISQKKIEYTMGRSSDSVDAPNPDILKGAREALDIIAAGGSQFFMMIEGAYIDKDSHNNRYDSCVASVKQYNEVIAYMATFVFCHPDTALIVTADHETGELTKTSSSDYKYGYKYTSGSSSYRQHTNNDVPVFALGPKTEYFNNYRVENVCIPHFAAQAFGDTNFGDPNYTKNREAY